MKSFIVWMEEKREKRELTHDILRRLGFAPDALENGEIMLDQLPKDKLKDAIGNLTINPEEKQKVINWAQAHDRESLTNLINQINPLSYDRQDKEISQPAVLPSGQTPMPKPQNPYQAVRNQPIAQ